MRGDIKREVKKRFDEHLKTIGLVPSVGWYESALKNSLDLEYKRRHNRIGR